METYILYWSGIQNQFYRSHHHNNDHNSHHLLSDHHDLQENITVSIIMQPGLNQDDVLQEIEIYIHRGLLVIMIKSN